MGSGPVGGFDPFPAELPDWSRPIVGALLLIAIGFGARAFVANARARRLERQRELLADDVALLQHALVPQLPRELGRLRLTAAYRPADGPAAGGDFYDVFTLPGERVGLIIGDVSGHGRDALERAALMRYTVRAYAEAGLGPRAALKLAGHVLDGNDPDGFVTAAVATFDPSAGTLTYALAGHHAPLLLGTELDLPIGVASSPPLGLGLPTGLRQTTVSLTDDALVCFFTDGLVEARVDGRMVGRESLGRALVELDRDVDAAAVLARAVEHAADDVALCILRPKGWPDGARVRVEELEIAPDGADLADARRLLAACGVGAEEVERAIEAALSLRPDAALMVVRKDAEKTSVELQRVDRRPVEQRLLATV